MSHSYDNTLLQRMGFSDPDRRTPAHDDACVQIASEPERFVRIVRDRVGVRYVQCGLELPLQKGEGKYASTVGFIDALVEWNDALDIKWPYGADGWRCTCGFINCRQERCSCVELLSGPNPLEWPRAAMLVEVKTCIQSIGDLLRQMNLYREYKRDHNRVPINEYVVWSLNADDARYGKLLEQQGYRLVAGAVL